MHLGFVGHVTLLCSCTKAELSTISFGAVSQDRSVLSKEQQLGTASHPSSIATMLRDRKAAEKQISTKYIPGLWALMVRRKMWRNCCPCIGGADQTNGAVGYAG